MKKTAFSAILATVIVLSSGNVFAGTCAPGYAQELYLNLVYQHGMAPAAAQYHVKQRCCETVVSSQFHEKTVVVERFSSAANYPPPQQVVYGGYVPQPAYGGEYYGDSSSQVFADVLGTAAAVGLSIYAIDKIYDDQHYHRGYGGNHGYRRFDNNRFRHDRHFDGRRFDDRGRRHGGHGFDDRRHRDDRGRNRGRH
ncbi:MAG: hypothetical protein UY41_C0043G0005 [Candidatus Moranbacteria bacterium GW2011_GWE1_49_15]|nr:MAG: hypothetical protein UY41_C0043G0005 [Candidatus Moranbacteria bacterium GW2011_GWE1_49_15]